jgi:hypothetical protein
MHELRSPSGSRLLGAGKARRNSEPLARNADLIPTDISSVGTEFGPWNPGIRSELPRRLVPLSTIFRPENVFTSVEYADELHDFSGLSPQELATFRPSRLVLHELLIRVTADLSVPDPEGATIEELGVNFRRMTHVILTKYIVPHVHEITAAYDLLKRALSALVDQELTAALFPPPRTTIAQRPTKRNWISRLFPEAREVSPSGEERWRREEEALRQWAAKAESADEPSRKAAYRSLARVVTAVCAKHGRIRGDKSLLGSLAIDLACNEYGSISIGQLIEPYIYEACEREGYRRVPAQERPMVMNTKGAPASGKSTLRPRQRKLATTLGVQWSDFAIISPDIWRKYLLDYSSLGDAYKYAGAFTGHELAIVDHKLDRYMADKAARHGISHFLIDRFRFDSFAPNSDEAGSNLLTRFGGTIYMFFMITPPDETVTRSWKRGLEVGRYKAVDDVLAQNVEAYTGIPTLFFTWARRSDKLVHYEFLDNSVRLGEQPRTVAFGWNGEMNILDAKGILDIERYRKINVDASAPENVYRDRESMLAANNTHFLAQCVHTIPIVNFAERATGRIYARFEGGRLARVDREMLEHMMQDEETHAGILAVAPDALSGKGSTGRIDVLQANRFHTLGRWGASGSAIT